MPLRGMDVLGLKKEKSYGKNKDFGEIMKWDQPSTMIKERPFSPPF